MSQTIEIPTDLVNFELPQAVQKRLQYLLDRQDSGQELTLAEREEAEGLVELSEFLSLLRLRSPKCTEVDTNVKDTNGIAFIG
jgi:hypothetical protein